MSGKQHENPIKFFDTIRWTIDNDNKETKSYVSGFLDEQNVNVLNYYDIWCMMSTEKRNIFMQKLRENKKEIYTELLKYTGQVLERSDTEDTDGFLARMSEDLDINDKNESDDEEELLKKIKARQENDKLKARQENDKLKVQVTVTQPNT